VLQDINNTGYGLTFGLHSRINDRVDFVKDRIEAGNIYINRNQIGAVVGSQPFGGEGLSGTGPKAGGPFYLNRFIAPAQTQYARLTIEPTLFENDSVQALVDTAAPAPAPPHQTHSLPGPTGETNELTTYPRRLVLCLGPSAHHADEQAKLARAQGCRAVKIAPETAGVDSLSGVLSPDLLQTLERFDIVAYWADSDLASTYRQALASRKGAILPLVTGTDLAAYCVKERHICTDTTAAGGNATLLAGAV